MAEPMTPATLGAMACMRQNLYVCGLSSSEFPGSPSENYLLLDSDYQLFAGEPFVEEEMLPTSANLMQKKHCEEPCSSWAWN